MPNIKSTISSHNKKVYNDYKNSKNKKTKNLCSCRIKSNCPLDNKCKSSCVYQATITNPVENKSKTYGGLAKDFKIRHSLHNQSFRVDIPDSRKKATALSIEYHKLKAKNIEPEIKYKILKHAQAYSPENKKCHLCIAEKYFILCKPELCTLNKRNELTNYCMHRDSVLLTSKKRRKRHNLTLNINHGEDTATSRVINSNHRRAR